jgi:hypothetical protein
MKDELTFNSDNVFAKFYLEGEQLRIVILIRDKDGSVQNAYTLDKEQHLDLVKYLVRCL